MESVLRPPSPIGEPCRVCGQRPPHEFRESRCGKFCEILCKRCRTIVENIPLASLPHTIANLRSLN